MGSEIGWKNVIENGFRKNPQNIHRGGRPKGRKSLSSTLRKMLESTITYTDLNGNETKMEASEALAIALILKALKHGDVRAIELIRDEIEDRKDLLQDVTDSQKESAERAIKRLIERSSPNAT